MNEAVAAGVAVCALVVAFGIGAAVNGTAEGAIVAAVVGAVGVGWLWKGARR